MVDAVIASPEVPVLDVAHEVLHEERIAVGEAVGDIDAPTDAPLLRPREPVCRAADLRILQVEAEHEVRAEAGRDPAEVVAAVGADEVRDDVASGPVAVGELAVIERHGRSPRVLESGVQPVLPEESEEVHTSDGTDGAPKRKEVRGEEVPDSAADALAAGVVPVELAVESQIAARQEVAIDVAEAQLRVDAGQVVSPLLRMGRVIPEARVEDRGGILAERQV